MSNAEFVKRLYQSFAAGDVQAVVAAMNSDINWREAEGNPYQMSGEAWVGPDAVVENLFAKLHAEWDGFTVSPESFHDAGQTVVVEGRYSGKYNATNRELDAQFCHVWRIENGKLQNFQQFTDTAQFQRVMNQP